ncbi:hypothetical protein KEJ39_09275 [Candidatus Bathyarchaeota archaeon]|nr:hypothetical protein [Candidatus Bathyarchaeota archaeon]
MGRAFGKLQRSVHTMSAFLCGLDVHRDSTYATLMDRNGETVSQRRIVNDRVLSYLSDCRIDRIGMEASNQVAPLYRQLRKRGYDVAVSHPKKARYIAEALSEEFEAEEVKQEDSVEAVTSSLLLSYFYPAISLSRNFCQSPLI